MKKILSSLLSLLLVFALCACTVTPSEKKEEYQDSKIQMDLNPSVEIIIDEEGNVVSITGLNDDGEILLSGEAIVGENFKVAVDTIVGLSVQMGYINKEDADEIEFSVSGDSEYASKVFEEVKTKAEETLAKYGINEVEIKQGVADAIEEVKAQIAAYLPDVDLSAYSSEQLYAKLGEVRSEFKEASLELVDQFKESQEIGELVNEVKTVIEYLNSNPAMSTITSTLKSMTGGVDVTTYLEKFENTFNGLIEKYKEYFVDPDSAYQEAKNAILDKKVEIATLKNEIAELDSESSEYQVKSDLITQAEAALDLAEDALEVAKQGVDQTIGLINVALNQVKTLVETIINTLKTFSADLKAALEQVESYDFESFKAEFETELKEREAELKEYKRQIIESLNVNHQEEEK